MEDKEQSLRNREYYLKNREILLEKAKVNQKINYSMDNKRAIIRERQKQYYQKNREDILKKAQELRDKHKDTLQPLDQNAEI